MLNMRGLSLFSQLAQCHHAIIKMIQVTQIVICADFHCFQLIADFHYLCGLSLSSMHCAVHNSVRSFIILQCPTCADFHCSSMLNQQKMIQVTQIVICADFHCFQCALQLIADVCSTCKNVCCCRRQCSPTSMYLFILPVVYRLLALSMYFYSIAGIIVD